MSISRSSIIFTHFAFACLVVSAPTLAQDAEPEFEVRLTKTATNPAPVAPQQTFEFEIRLENIGETTAQNLVVEDKLPPELAIPDGLVPTTSTGTYIAATQTWRVAELAPGAAELLVIPAMVQASPQPACIINEASLRGDDRDTSNNLSRAAIRALGVEHCVDLSPGWIRPAFGGDFCGGKQSVRYELVVYNAGPDDADDVTLSVTETSSFKLPGFSIDSDACTGLQCNWDTIRARYFRTVYASSKAFSNKTLQQHSISLAVTTADEDFAPDNDIETFTRRITSFQADCSDFGIPNPLSPGGGGGGGCFIATAAYGTPLDSRIDVLRDFRDKWLIPNAIGRHLVNIYYEFSPPLANYIAPRPWLRAVVRALLAPLLWLITYPLWFLMGTVTGISLLLYWRSLGVARRTG